MIASLGIGEVGVYRKLRVAFFSTGDELKSIGTPLAAGEIYDSNRYTLLRHADAPGLRDRSTWAWCATCPRTLERAFATAAATADVVITSGGVSVGEADFVKQLLDKLGEVLFWKIAMKPGRPLAYGKIGGAHFFGLPGNPVSVMVTFYQFVRDALLHPAGRARRRAAADVQGAAVRRRSRRRRAAPNSSAASCRRDGDGGWTRAHHRRPGLGHPVVDVAGELLHRPRHRHRQRRGRRAGRRAAARGNHLAAGRRCRRADDNEDAIVAMRRYDGGFVRRRSPIPTSSSLSHLLERNRAWAANLRARRPDFFLGATEQQTPALPVDRLLGQPRARRTTIVDLPPGEMFVHRNVANVVVHTDLNCLSVLQFAVEALKVRARAVVGHYGCGGVRAAYQGKPLGLIDNWLRHVQDVAAKHRALLERLPDDGAREDRLCELNVIEQLTHVARTTIVQDAWRRGQPLTLHGWIYRLHDGVLRDLVLEVD